MLNADELNFLVVKLALVSQEAPHIYSQCFEDTLQFNSLFRKKIMPK